MKSRSIPWLFQNLSRSGDIQLPLTNTIGSLRRWAVRYQTIKIGAEGGDQPSTCRGMTPWNTPSGCLDKLPSGTVYRQRLNGSTPLVPEPRPTIGGVTR